jgi:hypothetical protein
MVTEFENKQTLINELDLTCAFLKAWHKKFAFYPEKKQICVLLSQVYLETGRTKFCWNYNLGNIKKTDNDPYDYYFVKCNEIINGKVVWFDKPDKAARFVSFASLDEGVEFYLDKLYKRFGGAWDFVIAGDADGFSRKLKKLNYYTADVEQYTKGIVSIYNEIMNKPIYDQAIKIFDNAMPIKQNGYASGTDQTGDAVTDVNISKPNFIEMLFDIISNLFKN